MERRDLLKGLFTAAIATQLPSLPAEAKEAISETAPFMKVNGEVVSAGVDDIGNGYFRCWIEFTTHTPNPEMEQYAANGYGAPDFVLDFGKPGFYCEGDGLQIEGTTSGWEPGDENHVASVVIKPINQVLHHHGMTVG